MPHSSSAKKRHRQSLERRAKNRATKSELKTLIKKVRAAAKAGDPAKAEAEFRLTAKKLDRAGTKGVIHRNAASRTKSRLAHLLKVSKQPAAAKA